MTRILPEINQAAPDFTTPNQRAEEVKLSDFKGQKVLLYFYPKAMTPGCTTQACELTANLNEFEQLNTKVLGISPDKPEKLQKFIDKEALNFDLLSDTDHSIAEAYGVWGLKKFMGKEYDGIHRTSFFIDEQGTLKHIMEKVKTKTHHADALKILKEI